MIELMVAATVFAVAAVAFIGVLGNSVNLDQVNRERFWAREACRKQLEVAYALNFYDVSSLNGTTFSVGYVVNGQTVLLKNAAGSTQIGTITVSGANTIDETGVETGDAACNRVIVSATWRSRQRNGGVSENITVTLVGNIAHH